MEGSPDHTEELLALTADIVASHLANNQVAVEDVPALIESVFGSLYGLRHKDASRQNVLEPAVPIEESITPDHIICLEDGKKLKMLKRHLKSRYAMSPEDYRKKWSLPADYPMVAPNYALKRAELAKQIGLGRSRQNN